MIKDIDFNTNSRAIIEDEVVINRDSSHNHLNMRLSAESVSETSKIAEEAARDFAQSAIAVDGPLIRIQK